MYVLHFFLFTVRSVIIYNILAEKYQELSGDMYLAVTDFPALAVHIKNMEPKSENRQPAGCHENCKQSFKTVTEISERTAI